MATLDTSLGRGANDQERIHRPLQVSPNWITYRKVLMPADLLLDRLRPLGAKDMIDVQSFMWVIATYDR